jgi:ABC-type glycerol-3-phosphate transport system substrate-binding protein
MPYGVPEGEGNYPGTGGSIAALGGWHVGVNPNSENIDAVTPMLQAMQKPGFMKENFALTGWMPPVKDVLADSTDVDVMGRHVETLAYAGEHSIARPVTVLWPQEADAIEQTANTALQSGGNPSEQMSSLADRLTAIENDYEG